MAPSADDATTATSCGEEGSPDIYLHVLSELRLDPDHCLAFEDSSELGLRSSLGVASRLSSPLTPILPVKISPAQLLLSIILGNRHNQLISWRLTDTT